MHEKLLDKVENFSPNSGKLIKNQSNESPVKERKVSKISALLRHSFRQNKHKSLDINLLDPTANPLWPSETTSQNSESKQCLRQKFKLKQQSLLAPIVVTHFPGLSGYINPTLLPDSPEDCTPPEYAYQQLRSVTTTNSSTSLESNFDQKEESDSHANALVHLQRSSVMGGEVSSAASTDRTQPYGNVKSLGNRNCKQMDSSSKGSRSFSLASVGQQNNVVVGNSNEGFTASSSGEWEQLGTQNLISASCERGDGLDFQFGPFLANSTENDSGPIGDSGILPEESTDFGEYYQYKLSSPNNPFLPEITARTYHSTNKEDLHETDAGLEEPQLKGSVTAVKYSDIQLTYPTAAAYSRAGSQESTHSDCGINYPVVPISSPVSSSSSTPGRQKRKLFSLNSPTRLLNYQLQHNQNVDKPQLSPQALETKKSAPINSFNPFLSAKRMPPKQPGITSPNSTQPDLYTKRNEFLRATMDICLVVSPPSSKLQLKSKSLTHLDGLEKGVLSQQKSITEEHASSLTTTDPVSKNESVQFNTDCFSVCFYNKSALRQDVLLLPAPKGMTLINALNPELEKRNLSASEITIRDSSPTSSFKDPGAVDKEIAVERLVGHNLVVIENDNNRKTLQKAASFGSRQRPSRLLSSASTEETNESTIAAGKHIKQRWSSIFGTKNPQHSQLCELLNSYAKNGVPQRTDTFTFQHGNLCSALSYLHNTHKSWREFVESKSMTDSEIKIQTAIWELVTTEVHYIHTLQTITDLFLACLKAVQDEGLLVDVDQNRLFSNVQAVCETNIKFWTLWLYPMVNHSISTRDPMQCASFQEGFMEFPTVFAPYTNYCAEQSTCQFYCKDLNQNNPLFTSYLAWCESQKMCNRLRLADIVVRPMQRLTKYSLLLAAIKKHMCNVEDIESMDIMIHSVENFVCSVNNHLTMRQESERLRGVIARIESYDVVDTSNEVLEKLIKQHSQMIDLCAPMRGCPSHQVRHLFMEGDHKFKDNLGKCDVHCFLLTDMLLVCKTIAKKNLGALKVIRQPYITDRLIVQLSPNNTLNCVYLNEFQIAISAFTLQCIEVKNWYDALWRAKTIYQRLKRGVGANGTGSESFRCRGNGGATGSIADSLGLPRSTLNSSICSHVSSANNSNSGSVEWNDSRNISVDFEKTNSLSSDEGSSYLKSNSGLVLKTKSQFLNTAHQPKIAAVAPSNTLSVQPLCSLGQSLPNLYLQHSHTNNTLHVPGATSSHSGNTLLSPSHRGISYPPPSPTRTPLRRGMAFSNSTKNPPLIKTRNISSQSSLHWHQVPAASSPTCHQSQSSVPSNTNNQMINPVSNDEMAQAAVQLSKQNVFDIQALSSESNV